MKEGEVELRDIWVGVSIIVAWLLLLLSGIRAFSVTTLTTSEGVLIRRASVGCLQEQRTVFIYNSQFGYRQRTFADFATGSICPLVPPCSFQVRYRTTSRWFIYKSLAKGAFSKCWRFIIFCGLFAATLSWWTRNCRYFSIELHSRYMSYDSLFGNLKAAARIHSMLSPFAAFIIALYLNKQFNWFDTVISMCWGVQGDLHDLALVVAIDLRSQDTEAVLRAKYDLYRYLNAAHFFVYSGLAVDFGGIVANDLVQCGLLTAAEQELIDAAGNRRNMVILWIGSLLDSLLEGGCIRSCQYWEALGSLKSFRAKADGLGKEMSRMSPVSWAQQMQLLVDVLMLLTPPALAFSFETKREGFTVYLWPALGSMLLATFFQGAMRVISKLEYPFGIDLDDVHPDWCLASSEIAILSYLTSPIPKGLARTAADKAARDADIIDEWKQLQGKQKLRQRYPEDGENETAEADIQSVLPGTVGWKPSWRGAWRSRSMTPNSA